MNSYTQTERQLLLKVVDDVIKYGVKYRRVMPIDVDVYPAKFTTLGASFVTLELDGQLRGCIGSLLAYRPLILDIACNAFAAAFQDHRFCPITQDECLSLTKHISILGKPELVNFTTEEDLIAKLRPNIDGLVLSDDGYRGTFLPSVWEQLPNPKMFLQHLKMKAGLPADYWSNTIKVERYTTEVIE